MWLASLSPPCEPLQTLPTQTRHRLCLRTRPRSRAGPHAHLAPTPREVLCPSCLAVCSAAVRSWLQATTVGLAGLCGWVDWLGCSCSVPAASDSVWDV